MKHSQSPHTKERLDTLLRQYAQYSKATTAEEKRRIGDEMVYDDPVVWMMYKHKAYRGTHHEITTVGALREHCNDHGGICAKRFHYVSAHIMKEHGKNIRDPKEFSDDMPLEYFYESELLDKVVHDQRFMDTWKQNEFLRKDGRVAKWQNYVIEHSPDTSLAP